MLVERTDLDQRTGTGVAPRGMKPRFADLYPDGIDAMPVAWHQVRIPGAPPSFALTEDERHAADPMVRYRRRIIQHMRVGSAGGDHLALVDKALPHALYDLMLTDLSMPNKATATAVLPATGRSLWRTGRNFVRFVADPDIRREFDLGQGQAVLAMNCDPSTRDRESVQAAKQFHLHLLYWTAGELAPLRRAVPLATEVDVQLRRQALDPLAFLGARILQEVLAAHPPDPALCRLLPLDEPAIVRGRCPLGCVLTLPGWDVLDDPAFEALGRLIHEQIEDISRQILCAFTGRTRAPRDWHRHPLLPLDVIRSRLAALPLSGQTLHGLECLARALRNLPPATALRLSRRSPACRRHLMSLNQPCYTINLTDSPGSTARTGSAQDKPVLMILQTRLFSGIGGAGLLSLGSAPSVRIVRGQGAFSEEQWQVRAGFQQRFARFNQTSQETGIPPEDGGTDLIEDSPSSRPSLTTEDGGQAPVAARSVAETDATELQFEPVRVFAGPPRGWIDSERGKESPHTARGHV